MLTIRSEQLNVLDQASTASFHHRLMLFLRKEIPEATSSMDDVALMEYLIESERRASRYDIESEAGVAQFVCLTFAAGLKFDELPEVQSYLQQPGLEPEEKLDELVNYLNALEDNPDTNPAEVLLAPEN